jgi:hypothetical protein
MEKIEMTIFELEALRRRNQRCSLSDKETSILKILASGIYPATPEAASKAASQLDILCPPLIKENEAQNYLWTSWDMMLEVAHSPDVTHEIQDRLVSIVQTLEQRAKGNLNVHGVSHLLINFSLTHYLLIF